MADANWPLRNFLVESYDLLIAQLRRRLHSADLAQDVLHDTYLRLERAKEVQDVRRPLNYLMTVALNVARDRQLASNRLLSADQMESVLHLADEAPDPSREAEAKSELEAIERALAKLPSRRRAILLAACKENLPSRQIAQRFGLSVRKIDMELKLAREFCASELAGLEDNENK